MKWQIWDDVVLFVLWCFDVVADVSIAVVAAVGITTNEHQQHGGLSA